MNKNIKHSLCIFMMLLMMLGVGANVTQTTINAKNITIHKIMTKRRNAKKQLFKRWISHQKYIYSRKYLRHHPKIVLHYKYVKILMTARSLSTDASKNRNKKLDLLRKQSKRIKGFRKSQRNYLLREIREAKDPQIYKMICNLKRINKQIHKYHQRKLTIHQNKIIKHAYNLINKYGNDDIASNIKIYLNNITTYIYNCNHKIKIAI